MVGHVGIDLSGELDEARAEIPLFGFPRKIEGIHRNAMPPEARAGIEGMKTEGLGGSGFDDLPDIDAHAQAQELKFVDQSDVDAAVNVLQKFRHLRSGWRRDGNGSIEDGTVESGGKF